jgi:hypothetical protein
VKQLNSTLVLFEFQTVCDISTGGSGVGEGNGTPATIAANTMVNENTRIAIFIK